MSSNVWAVQSVDESGFYFTIVRQSDGFTLYIQVPNAHTMTPAALETALSTAAANYAAKEAGGGSGAAQVVGQTLSV